jgi:peptidyl-prolyl cis-trans isomerase SurA
MLKVAAALLILAFAAMPGLAPRAAAQTTVATVNGEPISSRELDQRIRLERLMFRRSLSRGQAIDALIDDRLKVAEGRRLGMRVTQEFMDELIGRYAAGNRQTRGEFEAALGRAGLETDALREKLRADTVWSEILKNRARASGASNAEIDAELERRRARGEGKVIDYVVRQVIFVVAGATGGAAQRQREANAARARFTDCETGIDYLRTLPGVAVRERIARTSTDLSERVADLLSKTPTGRLTAPFASEQGIEMLAVCERNERMDTGALRTRIEEELARKRVEGGADAYLRELRSRAEIVRR